MLICLFVYCVYFVHFAYCVYFAYLAYHGISNQTGEQVVLAVREKWNIQDILHSDKTKPEKNTLLLSIDKKEYLDYSDAQLEVYYSTPPPPPPTWVSGYSFDCLTPSVMHNLFLNVAKNIMKKLINLEFKRTQSKKLAQRIKVIKCTQVLSSIMFETNMVVINPI